MDAPIETALGLKTYQAIEALANQITALPSASKPSNHQRMDSLEEQLRTLRN